MSKSKPVLGRGLASLIPRPTPSMTAGGYQDDGVSSEVIMSLDLTKIKANPYQPRAHFDQVALDELTQSIREKGIIQPITVCRADVGYQLISGERRVRAAKEAGLTSIPAYIIEVKSREEMLELALIENLQREQLNPIEIAISYKRLIDECSLTQEQVSQRIGKDRTTVTNFLRLLKLPDEIKTSLRKNELSAGHARALVAIESEGEQMALFRKIVGDSLSVRAVEKLARSTGKKTKPSKKPGHAPDSALVSIEENLRQTLGTKVEVKMMDGGKGQIVIQYYSLDDLDRLLELFVLINDRTQ